MDQRLKRNDLNGLSNYKLDEGGLMSRKNARLEVRREFGLDYFNSKADTGLGIRDALEVESLK